MRLETQLRALIRDGSLDPVADRSRVAALAAELVAADQHLAAGSDHPEELWINERLTVGLLWPGDWPGRPADPESHPVGGVGSDPRGTPVRTAITGPEGSKINRRTIGFAAFRQERALERGQSAIEELGGSGSGSSIAGHSSPGLASQ